MNETMMRSVLTTICVLSLALQAGCQAPAPPLPWTGATRIATLPGYYYPRLPALSPNGEQLAILGAVAFDLPTGRIMIWDITSETWTPIELGDRDYSVTYLDWDSTSTRLLFEASDKPVIYNLTDGVVESLNTGSERFEAIWGPMDNQITKYILKPAKQDLDQGKRVEILNLSDNSEEYLFTLDWVDVFSMRGMDWSPDGNQLLFSVSVESGRNNDIFVFDRQTGATKVLVNTVADEQYPHWSPDGQWFVYLASQYDASGSELVISSVSGNCVIRKPVPVRGLFMEVDWGTTDQLAVVYSNALYLVDMQEAFGFGLDNLADHCENP